VTEPLPSGIERNRPLARLSTVRTGGSAELFSRPASEEQVSELLAWAQRSATRIWVVGSGSNLLIADQGVSGLVLKLEGQLAAIERSGERLLCGAAARLPAVAAQAARDGLSGIEFGVNIPGTVGGAVQMNANAYGGELARVLEWVRVATARGVDQRAPQELGFAYRSSNLAQGEIVTRACFALKPADPAAVRATLAQMRTRRHAAQPQGIRTFGSTFKNPDEPGAQGASAGVLLDRAGCRGLAVGGARFSEKHANFIENAGSATTAEIVALMAEGRRRVLERFGVALEPEVQTLGDVRFPWRERNA
jgi:UDP-N-acetylmuramate dehydrogenase